MKVVIDANIAVAVVLPLPYSPQASHQVQRWQKHGTQLVAPTLWGYEVLTSVRKAAVGKMISLEEAREALDEIFALGVQQVPTAAGFHQNIFEWAVRLNHTQAYDAAYLALAEQLGADFWTADKRLANTAKQLKLTWVYHVG
jgi:predicted nucleic acid-binding protein